MKDGKKLFALGLASVFTIGLGSALAFTGNETTETNNTRPQWKQEQGVGQGQGSRPALTEEKQEEREAQRAEIDALLEAGDYTAFQEAVAETPLADRVSSEEEFQEMVTRHAGRGDHEANREAIEAAIEAGDYSEFQELTADSPIAEKIDTAEQFAKLQRLHEIRGEAEALREEARAIQEELGLGKGGQHEEGEHRSAGRSGQGVRGEGMGNGEGNGQMPGASGFGARQGR